MLRTGEKEAWGRGQKHSVGREGKLISRNNKKK